jgi:hypothetical protein
MRASVLPAMPEIAACVVELAEPWSEPMPALPVGLPLLTPALSR